MISLTESFLRALGTRGLKLFIRATNKKVKFLPLCAGQPLLNKLLNLYKKTYLCHAFSGITYRHGVMHMAKDTNPYEYQQRVCANAMLQCKGECYVNP